MSTEAFLQHLARRHGVREQIYHIEELPERPAAYADVELDSRVRAALAARGIERLYTHQAEAICQVRAGRNVVIVTGTASGKTLCYHIPILESALNDPMATALAIYPTKALAQDQFRGLSELSANVAGLKLVAGPYDGDTPAEQRRKLRDRGSVILTNPDMLHQGILPHHARWGRFFTNLRYVVIDEVHAYRGVFGSHLANVLRRLHRICRHFGSRPQFICSSATIANPKEHAERVTREPMELVTNDGSPRGRKKFLLWNPPLLTGQSGAPENWQTGGERRSALWTAVELMTSLVRSEIQTIVFTQTRLAAELIFAYARQMLEPHSPKLAERVQAYRGGYLPEERREIERRLASGEILGVASTNALELGIDIGSLDACLLVGYPGTIASLWQRAGRAGRGADDALVVLIAQNSPIDQFLMYHSDYLFQQNPERAIIDPDNPHIVVGHLKCAVHELPLPDDEVETFGPYADAILKLLEEGGSVRHIGGHSAFPASGLPEPAQEAATPLPSRHAEPVAGKAECPRIPEEGDRHLSRPMAGKEPVPPGKWYWASSAYPAAEVNLRNLCGPVYTIQAGPGKDNVIGTMDEVSALSQLHDHAVYLHSGDTYFVTRLDLEKKIAFVERRDLDYYTQAVQSSQIRLDRVEQDGDRCLVIGDRVPEHPTPNTDNPLRVGFGDVTVTTSIPMFKKVKFHSRDSLGFEKLELPPQQLETVALWLVPPDRIRDLVRSHGRVYGEGLTGIANALVEVAPMFVMCDVQDIGVVVDATNLGKDAIFLYDRYPGGMGYAERCVEVIGQLLSAVHTVVSQCGCEDGCPSCVGAAVPAFALGDLDSAVRGRIPDKEAALIILCELLGLEPYRPRLRPHPDLPDEVTPQER